MNYLDNKAIAQQAFQRQLSMRCLNPNYVANQFIKQDSYRNVLGQG